MKFISLGVVVALLVLALGCSNLSGAAHEVHHKSPAYAAGAAKSTLESGVKTDSINCVEKLFAGFFTAKSRTFNNGNVTDVVRADTSGERNCHYTGVNNGAHQAGTDPGGDGGPTNWGDRSDHGT
jgi:hypothetical protein